MCTLRSKLVLKPAAGWIAESWMGRYRVIVVGLLMCTVTVIMAQFAFIMLTFNWTPVPAIILISIATICGAFGFGCLYTIMLPFTLDQMIGASAEELSAAVQWYYWGFFLSPMIKNALPCIPIPSQLQLPGILSKDILPVVFLAISSLSLSAALIIDCLYHKWLDTNNKTGNPIKLIFQVLNYARKNKYPQLRSAFTYIDEEHPSRIDFGKHKFGGPFTEEEVEDVKTIFRILPILLVCVLGAYLSLEDYDQLALHAIQTTKQTFDCVQNLKSTVCYVAIFLLVPVYRFLVHPFLGKYIPSMLKVMAVGLSLSLVVAVIHIPLLSIGHFNSNSSHCVFDDLTETGTLHIPLYWVLIIDFVNGVGFVLTMCLLFEFVIAQTPNRMRGIMMGLVSTAIGIGILGTYILHKIFQQFQAASPSCVFYYYLVLSLILLLILIVFANTCEVLQAEREGKTRQHTGHSRGIALQSKLIIIFKREICSKYTDQ